MLYTLTTNPAVDMNVTTDQVEAAAVNRTRDPVYTPNGKGLNVSFTLRHFGVDSGIAGFFGGFSGDYITTHCEKEGYPLVNIGIDGVTRINLFVCSPGGEYKFVNSGPKVALQAQQQMLASLEALPDLELLSIHGSAANGQAEDFYDRIFEICGKRQIPVILDISSPKLKELLQYRPLLIKPNDDELREVFGLPAGSEQEIASSLLKLHELGAQNILLTMGDKGSYFSDGESLYRCGTKKVTLKSSACAGDASLGGFLSIWLKDRADIERALRRSAATGANTAESDGLGDFAMVEEYEKSIKVERIGGLK